MFMDSPTTCATNSPWDGRGTAVVADPLVVVGVLDLLLLRHLIDDLLPTEAAGGHLQVVEGHGVDERLHLCGRDPPERQNDAA